MFVTAATPVAGTNDTQFTATFARALTTTGWYTLTVSYLAHDAAGNGLDQNGNGVNGETTDWFTVSVALPPPTGSTGKVTVAAVGLPTRLGQMPVQTDADALMTLIAQDKKVKRGKLTFILARGIGQAFVAADVDPGEVRAFLEQKLTGI